MNAFKYVFVAIASVILGMFIGVMAGTDKAHGNSFDAVYLTLEAITYQDLTGKRYLRYDLETTAEYFAEN